MTHFEKPKQSEFKPVPVGTHIARCYRIIELGTQDEAYQGQIKKHKKIMLSFEIPNELMDDGKPFTAHKKFTFSSHEKANFRKFIEAWLGAKFKDETIHEFEIDSLLGKECFLSIGEFEYNGETRTGVAGILPMTKGVPVPSLVNPAVSLWLKPEAFNRAVFDSLSNGIKETIMRSPEWLVLNGQPTKAESSPMQDDAIPFN